MRSDWKRLLGTDGAIALKCLEKKWSVMVEIILSENIARVPVFVHSHERPTSLKDRTFIERLLKYKVLKNVCAQWISMVRAKLPYAETRPVVGWFLKNVCAQWISMVRAKLPYAERRRVVGWFLKNVCAQWISMVRAKLPYAETRPVVGWFLKNVLPLIRKEKAVGFCETSVSYTKINGVTYQKTVFLVLLAYRTSKFT
jgi:hypothetical protein